MHIPDDTNAILGTLHINTIALADSSLLQPER